MRIGKFEKWILIRCYLKTVKRQLPEGWKMPRGFYKRKQHETDFDYDWRLLFKSETLLNYFHNLQLSQKECYDSQRREKFANTREYRSALALTTRTLYKLVDKGLVSWREGQYASWSGRKLTDKGKEKALELLNVNSGVIAIGFLAIAMSKIF